MNGYLGDTWRVTTTTRRRMTRFGDALTDAQQAERAKINAAAASYALPDKATTHAEAVMAFILLMRAARDEDPKSAGVFVRQANEAAWKFRTAPNWNILQTAVDLTRAQRRTNELARIVFAASAGTAPAPTTKPAARSTSASYTAPVVAAPVTTWQDKLREYAPWLVGGAFVVSAGLALFPGRRSVP